jgi:hypothetical protein
MAKKINEPELWAYFTRMADNGSTCTLAPYEVHRLWDGEVCWVLKDTRWHVQRYPSTPQVIGIYDDKEEAEQERNRRNSAHALDILGIC